MTLNIGDKALLIPNIQGKPLVIPIGTPEIGNKSITIPTDGGPVVIPLGTPEIGDKSCKYPDQSGKGVIINSSAAGGGYSPTGRMGHAMVTLSDGSIVVIGGKKSNTEMAHNVIISYNDGLSWAVQTTEPEWPERYIHSCVVLADDTIILSGGRNLAGVYFNDVWKSEDGGRTWTQLTAAAWVGARAGHRSVVTSTGHIIVMGGLSDALGGRINEVWKSVDNGVNWTLVTAHAGWSWRYGHVAVILSDDTILVMAGNYNLDPDAGQYDPGTVFMNDIWYSPDEGANWTRSVEHAEWFGRQCEMCAVLLGDHIVLMGALTLTGDLYNDIWESITGGATWTQITADSHLKKRHLAAATKIPTDKLIITGGYNIVTIGGFPYNNYLNDTLLSANDGLAWSLKSNMTIL